MANSDQGISHRDVRQILDAIGDDQILLCRLLTESFDITLAAEGFEDNASPVRASAALLATAPAPELPTVVSPVGVAVARSVAHESTARHPTQAVSAQPDASSEERLEIIEGGVAVRSPMIGVFYRAPNPEAPPFVEVGMTVSADTTVGLVEAMKVFAAVPAGSAGVVARISAENGQFVEYGQDLMTVVADVPS